MAESKKTRSHATANPEGVNLSEVERLLEFMSTHGLEEFEYGRGDFHIRLKKASNNATPVYRAVSSPDIVIQAPSAVDQVAPARAPETPAESGRGEDLHVVNSPIVGTFYGSPNPGAEPFVRVGDRVKSGQVLCIIEAMKLMNEIESDVDGEVMRVYVENGQPVEYGEALFGIHPHRKK